MANRTLAVIRRLYNFGIARDIVEVNPTTLIKPPSKEQRRNRVLSEKEIIKFWRTLDKTDMGSHVKVALKLILITAQRPGEVISAEWSEIDLEGEWWTIPEEKSKNKLPHRVPLSPIAIQVMHSLERNSRFLFPARIGTSISNEKPMTNRSLPHAVRRNNAVFKLDHFTPHDLRRTAASHMASMGIQRITLSKILNHIESNVTAIYDRHGYDNEKRTALNAWSQKLMNILEGKKGDIIPLTR
jgi:integrase